MELIALIQKESEQRTAELCKNPDATLLQHVEQRVK